MRTPLTSRGQRLAVFGIGAVLALGAIIIRAEAAGNAAIHLKKDSNGLFLLTIKDPEGIREFSLEPPAKSRYAGEIPGCPRTFQSTNVLFADPGDFTPVMNAYVVDCAGNRDDLQIPPPQDGAARSRRVSPPAPPPAPAAEQPAEAPAAPAVPAPEERAIQREAAREKANISYPIAELGNCGSEASCRAYCDDLANVRVCIDFAERHGFISPEEAAEGRRFAEAGGAGPGGCTSRDSCTAYCEDISHIEECLDFGERNGFLSGRELEEAKIVARLKREGQAFPGGCTSKASCETYCTQSGHEDECIAFGERSGLIPPEELAMAKKMLPLIKAGATPGGCKTKAECEAYCQELENMRACIAFAEEQGLIPPEELEMAKKFLPLMEKGETPGGCRSKEACEAYCSGEGHFEECIEFGVKGGFISEADAELARKAGGKGPGGCKSKEECESFCRQPENLETCTTFAREHGIETAGPGGCKDIEECRAYCQDPAHQDECEDFAKERGLGITGPGGCEGKDQCSAYCQDPSHRDECEAFFQDQGIEFSGPGGCTSFAECESYCRVPEHLEECQGFTGGQGGGLPGGGNFPGGFPPPPGGAPPSDSAQHGGPGGCRSAEECTAYCTANPADPACAPYIGGSGAGPGPGGCRSEAECRAYCQTNYTDPACAGIVGTPIPPPPPPPSTQSCVPPPSGLVSWWKGETDARDSANGNSGALSGSVTVADGGKIGKAFRFQGGSVNIGNPANLNFGTGPFSLEAWFQWDGAAGVNNIIRKSNYPATGPGSGYWLRVGNGTLEFSVGATTGPEGQSIITAPVSSGAWHHTVGTKDGSGNLTLYVDGRSQGTILRQAPNTESTSDDPFALGSWRSSTEFFYGAIDEVSVYNRALSAQEAQAIFGAGSAGKCSAFPSAGADGYQPPAVNCSLFAAAPNCSYVGPVGSQNYNYCVQCFPDRAAAPQVTPLSSRAPVTSPLGLIIAPFIELFR